MNLLMTEVEAALRAKDAEIERLRSELRSMRMLVGYIVMEGGEDGELMISNRILQQYDRFTIERHDDVRGGIMIRAIPE